MLQQCLKVPCEIATYSAFKCRLPFSLAVSWRIRASLVPLLAPQASPRAGAAPAPSGPLCHRHVVEVRWAEACVPLPDRSASGLLTCLSHSWPAWDSGLQCSGSQSQSSCLTMTPREINVIKGGLQGDNRMWMRNSPICWAPVS